MKSLLKKPLRLCAPVLFGIFLNPFAAQAAEPSPVTIKCQVTYEEPFERSDERILTLKTKATQHDQGTHYGFSQLETFSIAGRPDLKISLSGEYFHDAGSEANSFFHYTAGVCQNLPSESNLRCYGVSRSGLIFANVVRASTIYRGKKIQMGEMAIALASRESMEAAANYYLKTGHSIYDDINPTDAAQRKKYAFYLHPNIEVNCSVQDDVYGVVSAF